ncbi:MAG TPA: peptidylprolyl isomerase [Gemmatimonadaceae bacterium]|nr:peptidylprolyl isomerase [Gemmatimonadaceae bacterium]
MLRFARRSTDAPRQVRRAPVGSRTARAMRTARGSLASHASVASLASLAGVAALATLAGCGAQVGRDAPKATSDVGLPPTSAAEAPATFKVRFETSKGAFVLEAHRAWAPKGVDRLHSLVQSGFFDNTRFFRTVTGFMVQFGVHGDPGVNAAWENLAIPDDSVAQSNTRGRMSFAMAGPGTRTTQVFINLVDNASLDKMGFAPVGEVIEGMAVVDSLYAGYGDGPPSGFGPDQMRLMREGNAYLDREYPKLDFIRTARLVEDTPAAGDRAGAATDPAAKPGAGAGEKPGAGAGEKR